MDKNENPEKKEKNYTAIGMALGSGFGGLIGTALMFPFGIFTLAYCAGGGMVIGMLIGMSKKKR